MILALVLASPGIITAEAANEEEEKAEVLTPLQQQMQKTISITFRETPIDDVLRAIAEKANVDIIKSPQVTGMVTATLTDVPLGEALDNILASHGYGYVADKNVIRVAPLAELAVKEEVMVSRIYRITYADVKDVAATVKDFISQRGSVSASESTSNIIVTDTESRIKAIDTFIAEIDRITPQILVEARIYDITAKDKLDLGIDWWVNRQSYWQTDPLTGAIVPTTNRQPYITSTFDSTVDKATSSLASLNFGIWNDDLDIDAVIRAEQEDENAKLLANPRILVLDNEQAVFDIVQEYPYVERTITGNTVTETVKFKPIGTKLQVTPHVTRDGMLRLHILPEFGVKVGDVPMISGTVPVVDTRKVDTIALVQDGQTVVIGGLRKKNVTQQTNKVPLLGDIPVLGLLFRFEGEDVTNSELVVFITPRIIEQPVLTEAERQAYEVTEFDTPVPVTTRAEKADAEVQDKLPETVH
jgi:type IV pilus assembly protein PilQ